MSVCLLSEIALYMIVFNRLIVIPRSSHIMVAPSFLGLQYLQPFIKRISQNRLSHGFEFHVIYAALYL